MRFRLKAFGLHLLASVIALTLLLGTLYFGWYRWPGWYLADALPVVLVLIGVDAALGPLLTGVIASPGKPRRTLARDIAVIAAVQVIAMIYGAVALWHGRPLYYAYSETVLQLIQAYDIDPQELTLARQQHADLAPEWHSLPRWIWAPLPEIQAERDKVVASAVSGGMDVISMPRYYRHWEQGLPTLKQQLKKVDDVGYFSLADKKVLKQRMRAAGLPTDQPNSIPFIGRGTPLLAVFDPATVELKTTFKTK